MEKNRTEGDVNTQSIKLKVTTFNTLKLDGTLRSADAILRPISFFWIIAVMLVGFPYVHDPLIYPVYSGFIYSSIMYGAYYALIGSIRKKASANLDVFAASYGVDSTKYPLVELEKKLNFEIATKDKNDSFSARMIYGILNFFHIPRRGLLHRCVAISQGVFLGLYVYNYTRYFGIQNVTNTPDLLWMLHATTTSFGFFAVLKNSSFLITSRLLLALVSVVLDMRGTGRRVADHMVDEEDAHLASVKKAMEQYGFPNVQSPPPPDGHIVKDVPLVLVPENISFQGSVARKKVWPPEKT